MIYCKRCGYEPINESEVQLHHIIPKCLGGNDGDGRMYLCQKHHDIIYKMALKKVWQFVPENSKEACKNAIKAMTLNWANIEEPMFVVKTIKNEK